MENLGFKDGVGQFTPLTNEEYEKLTFLEEIIRRAYRFWEKNKSTRMNLYCYFPTLDKSFSHNEYKKFIDAEGKIMFDKIKKRHKYNVDLAIKDYYGHLDDRKLRDFEYLKKKYEESL